MYSTSRIPLFSLATFLFQWDFHISVLHIDSLHCVSEVRELKLVTLHSYVWKVEFYGKIDARLFTFL